MDSTSDLIIDSLKEEPIGETDHFIWFITDIGIAALFKREQNYEVHSWIFMVQNGIGHSVVSADSLETIWKQWHPWRRLMVISIQPCMDLDETVGLFKKQKMNTRIV